MAFTPYRGSGGRVVVGSTNFAGINRWNLDKQVDVVDVTNFESAADANSIIWKQFVTGLGGATGSLEGRWDGDTTNSEELTPIGTQVTLDLLFFKTGPIGYLDLPAIVTGISPSQTLTDAANFRMTFTVTGAPAVAN
jgi:hypothetical protein